MKIQPISYSVYKNNYKNAPISFRANEETKQTDFFQAKIKQNGFMDKLKAFFTKTFPDLSKEETISEKVGNNVDEIILTSKKLEKIAKSYYSLAKNTFLIGRNKEFKQYCDYSKKEREKLVFGDIDARTGMPSTMTHISMADKMKTIRYYEFYNGLDLYKVQDYSIPDVEDEIILNGKNIISLKEINFKDKTSQNYIFTSEGFYFYEGEIDNLKKLRKIGSIFNYNKKDLSKDEYITVNQDGRYDIYRFDENKQLWIKKTTIDEIDISDIEN